ncbi:unknown [Firmicutes bacterium CAG:137]|nr:unknown [Firmicutes bacterium CAG:137]
MDPLASLVVVQVCLSCDGVDVHLAGNRQVASLGSDRGAPHASRLHNAIGHCGNLRIVRGPGHVLHVCIVRLRQTGEAGGLIHGQIQFRLGQEQCRSRFILRQQGPTAIIGLEQAGELRVVLRLHHRQQAAIFLAYFEEIALANLALVTGPIELVGLMIHRHALGIGGVVAALLRHASGRDGLRIHSIEAALTDIHRKQLALVIAGQGQQLGIFMVYPLNHAQIRHLTGEIVHRHQVAPLVLLQLVCKNIEGIRAVVKGHVQGGIGLAKVAAADFQIAQLRSDPGAGLHGENLAVDINADDVAVHIFRSRHSRIAAVILGGMLEHFTGIFKGVPTIESIRCIQVPANHRGAVPPVGIEGIKAYVVCACKGDLIVGLVAAIVANRNAEGGVVLAHINGHQGLLTGLHIHRDVLVSHTSLRHGHHGSDVVVVGDVELQPASIGIGIVQIGNLIGIELGGFRVNDHRNLNTIIQIRLIGNSVIQLAIIQEGIDGKRHPVVVRHCVAAIRIFEVVRSAGIAVGQGHADAVPIHVEALTGIGVPLIEQLISRFIGPGKVHQLRCPHHTQIDFIDHIQIPIAVGRQHIVGRIIGLRHIGIQSQIGIAGTIVGKKHIGIPVAQHILALIVPANVKDLGIAPVAVESHEGKAQVHPVLALGIQPDKAVHVNAIFIILVHVGLVRIGQGHRNMYRSRAVGRHLHHIQGGKAGRDLLKEDLHICRVQNAIAIQVKVLAHRLAQLLQAVDAVQKDLNVGHIHCAVAVHIIELRQLSVFRAKDHRSAQGSGGLAHKGITGVIQIHLIRQSDAVQGVHLLPVRQVIHLEGEAVHTGPVVVVTHGDLGRLLRAVTGSEVGGADHGMVHVGRACALLPGGVQNARGLFHRHSSAHDQGLGNGMSLAICEIIRIPQVLQHQGAHTGNVGRSH